PHTPSSGTLPVAELAAVTGNAVTIPQAPMVQSSPPPVILAQKEKANDTQYMLNQAEFTQRSQNLAGQQNAFILPATPAPRPTPVARVETTLQPVWVGGELYLVRRIRRGGMERLQGIWIDWSVLR